MSSAQTAFDAETQSLSGPHAIEASAGTGKTFSITVLWLRLLVEQNLTIDQILVTTFTNAATAELQERLLAALRRALAAARGEQGPTASAEAAVVARALATRTPAELTQRLQSALSNFDLAPIYTIHGFCQSLIRRHAIELACDPALELRADAGEIVDEVVVDQLMRGAADGLVAPADAAEIAACLAREMSVQDTRLAGPAVVADASDAALALARDELQRHLPDLHATLAALKLGNSLATSVAKIRSLADGTLPAPLPTTVRGKLDKVPGLLAAVDRLEACLEARRDATTNAVAAAVRSEFPKRKILADIRTFDDILLTIHDALKLQGGHGPLARAVQARFQAAIVDECQDSDGVQIGIFRALFGNSQAFLVIGDPKQSIYRFRGADLASYQALTARATRAPEMTRNFRSDGALVEAVNQLYAKHRAFRGAQPDTPIGYVTVDAVAPDTRIVDRRLDQPVSLLWSPELDRGLAKHAIAGQIANEFQRILREDVQIIDRETRAPRPLVAADLAVLAANHADLSLVRQALQSRGIACQQSGKGLGSVWQSAEALDVQAWLEALATLETHNDVLKKVLTFAATPLLAYTATELDALRQNPPAQAQLIKALQGALDGMRFQGPLPSLQECWANVQQIERSLGAQDGERRLTNWRHLGTLIQAQWARGMRQASELAAFVVRRRAEAKADGEADLMKLETDLPAVQLMTIHSAKGLEFPVVACPFLWHVKSLAYRKQTPVALVRAAEGTLIDFGSAEFAQRLDQALQQEDDEQQRLLYVALTRARHRLYVGLAPVTGKNANAATESELVALLGLRDVDPSAWPERSPIKPLELKPVTGDRQGPQAEAPARLREPTPAFARNWQLPLTRCASYSSLTRDDNGDPHDHDPDEAAGRRLPGLLAALGPGGNRLGDKVHNVLEDVIGNGTRLELAVGKLAPAWLATMQAVLDAPLTLGDAQLNLGKLGGRAIAEMHFLLPVSKLAPKDLSRALLADPTISGDPDRRAWAEGVALWPFKDLQGFLQGYIDLIFAHDGKWYVVDYKTNSLTGYGQPELEAAMLEHNYLLQARLYAVALHRHLRATLADYQPERHLGGCGYLFLRGFANQGVWFEQPNCEALAALDQIFAKGTA